MDKRQKYHFRKYSLYSSSALELLPLALCQLADMRQLPLDEPVLHLQLAHARPQRRGVGRRQVLVSGRVHLPCSRIRAWARIRFLKIRHVHLPYTQVRKVIITHSNPDPFKMQWTCGASGGLGMLSWLATT